MEQSESATGRAAREGPPGIEVQGLVKDYRGRRALRGVDLSVAAGTSLALLGPNGAGKSTMIKILSGLLRPSAGAARVLGRDVLSEPLAVKALVGVSPQETAVAPRLSCEENLLLIAGAYGMDRRRAKERSRELLEALGLGDRTRDRASSLSGGMERRLSIAMALVADPPVLFLDEPSVGLDPEARAELWRLIAGLRGRKTLLLTTHYLEEAGFLADRVAVLVKGAIVAEGSPDAIRELDPAGKGSLDSAYLALVSKEGCR